MCYQVQAWSPPTHSTPSTKFPPTGVRIPRGSPLKLLQKCQAYALSAAILASTQITFLPHDTSSYCHAYAPDISSAANLNLERTLESDISTPNDTNTNGATAMTSKILREGLSRPTEERPQIKPPTSSMVPMSPKAKQPILEGMVYMADEYKYDRPDPSEIIVLTVSSASQPDDILAGAKYPVYKARMPFNFQMYDANILKNKMGQFRMVQERGEDFIVSATVCPGEDDGGGGGVAGRLPCDAGVSSYQGRGVGKLLQVPGMQEGEMIRTPASLALEKNKVLWI